MIGEAKVVVGAEVQHLLAVGNTHVRTLWRGEDALVLIEARGPNRVKLALEFVSYRCEHGFSLLLRQFSSCWLRPAQNHFARVPAACSKECLLVIFVAEAVGDDRRDI